MPALSYPARRQTSLTQARTGTERGTELNVFKICLRTSDDDGCRATYRLIDSTAPVAARLIRLAWVPGLRSMTRQLLSVMDGARRP
jgi:hypothetical protein